MKLSAQWIRDFVDAPVDSARFAEDLTSIGIAVEGISGELANTVFEMEIGTNRPDAMNHYGVAREEAALYGVEIQPLETSAAKAVDSSPRDGSPKVGPSKGASKANNDFEIDIDDADGCARYTAQI